MQTNRWRSCTPTQRLIPASLSKIVDRGCGAGNLGARQDLRHRAARYRGPARRRPAGRPDPARRAAMPRWMKPRCGRWPRSCAAPGLNRVDWPRCWWNARPSANWPATPSTAAPACGAAARAYNAAPSAIGVNYGSWCMAFARTSRGATRAMVGGCATGELPIPVSGSVCVPRQRRGAAWIAAPMTRATASA